LLLPLHRPPAEVAAAKFFRPMDTVDRNVIKAFRRHGTTASVRAAI
jgi:hypothetical protein